MAVVLNGKKIAAEITQEIKQEVAKLDRPPKLAVLLVGEDQASQRYVDYKRGACREVGIGFQVVRLPAGVNAIKVKEELCRLNQQVDVDGLILQLPLPVLAGEDSPTPILRFTRLISSHKDVDGLNQISTALLSSEIFLPATAQAVMRLIRETKVSLEGKKAVVVGRSQMVGKPVAQLLLLENATVTVCHSKTKDLAAETKQADILVAAAGVPGLISDRHVKEGAVVIDVGFNWIKNKITGDVCFQEVKDKASWITPVPGGVGPLTVAYLLKNVLQTAK
ncbi:bifunctional 5,10-methylenetetrahydrofolate dehydrogenase/5,10-methenyltetrahydrofolate cyclohydrolase [Patescibacteria group bacterium]|nr:bifunctional 5,10-methylenetetrahydrofolate dehydrogenase/5,10-methenyltetrahydrofolate cyclohydrolase [Patescibacteria group bacterium]MBU1867903.1 bifunctional 5,10-methylenetetrahydrofolate dehydrogenase/5,10-methenyltetrahydrofolate cyclohydrolase [Patescibacteria group bacterium]